MAEPMVACAPLVEILNFSISPVLVSATHVIVPELAVKHQRLLLLAARAPGSFRSPRSGCRSQFGIDDRCLGRLA